jgi:hypothetical protein
MILYAIRHHPTGLFLPRKEGRGATHREPTARLSKARLFHRERDARGFLTVWLQGKQTARACMSSHESFFEDDIELVLEPVPSRKREEMEIVAYSLTYDGIVG